MTIKNKQKHLIVISVLFVIFISGCATVPVREALPAYNINGATYYPLASLCELRNVSWQYNKFTKNIRLEKGIHRVNLKVGDNLAMVDGRAEIFNHPVDIYQGEIVVPYKFKEQVIDVLFKEVYPVREAGFPFGRIRKIVIDAGHGGNDPGAIGRSDLQEKDVNLDIAKRLSSLLKSKGVEVVMSRAQDKFIPLPARIEIANNSGSDLFISIHSNANHARSLKGFEVYYISSGANDSKRALNAAKNATLDLDSACLASNSLNLKAILWDMLYTFDRAESIELSRAICRSMDNNSDTKILGIKGANFEVLRGVRMPAVLIETGFLSNRDEERMLRNSYYRQKIAEAIIQGIGDYAKGAPIMEAANK
jgi:N-acetylmuramoyl-L-alanine amidase